MSCREAIRIGVQGGARNLGRDDIGQIAPGFAADFIAYDTLAHTGQLFTFSITIRSGLVRLALIRYQ
jgi:cytosine/adenosine deaminase-related metal-dependent hydrolase